MQSSIDSILQLGERCRLNGELVLVEWNPPSQKAPLAEALEWPDELDSMSARIVTVPPEIHASFNNADQIPLFEYIAKNTGIRRAESEFVVSTNPDLVYNEALLEFLATHVLENDCFYRIHRYDVDRLVPLDKTVDERESVAASHVFKHSTINDGYATADRSKMFREEIKRLSNVVRKNPAKARYLLTDHSRVANFAGEIYRNIFSSKSGREMQGEGVSTNRTARSTPHGLEDIFMTSSGDFLLMSADRWGEMHGYPERPTNLHVDSFGCIYAAKMGLDQIVLKEPLKIYHQEHDRSARDSRPAMEKEDLVAEAQEILDAPSFNPENDESWGLGDETLEETTVA